MSGSDVVRVAVTLEQCWHRVPGGTAVAALGMARALLERPDVDPVGVAARHRSEPPPPWLPPVRVEQLPLPRPVLYESWHRLRRPRVERATGRVDVIHATSIAIPPRSAPLVVTVHDLAFVDDPSHFTKRGLGFFRRGLRLALAEADLVLCPSHASARACEAAGFEPPRVRVVPLGVEVDPAPPEAVDDVRRRYGLAAPYALWAGTIEPRKNLPRLLEAHARIGRDVDLVLVGPRGWNEELDELPRVAGRSVKLLGFVPREHLGPLYAGAEVFCFPSLLEGFGFPVLEAMAQGTPVVTSRATSTEELAEGAGVLVDARDPESIAAGMERVLADGELAAELARAGPKRAAEYTWSRTAATLAEAYREVAA